MIICIMITSFGMISVLKQTETPKTDWLILLFVCLLGFVPPPECACFNRDQIRSSMDRNETHTSSFFKASCVWPLTGRNSLSPDFVSASHHGDDG